jgi:hypothetical protein
MVSLATVTGAKDIPFPTSSFLHDPLDNTRKQIRLVRLMDFTRRGIQCELGTFDLDSATIPSYRALSYTWGVAQPNFQIILNGRWFRVRENLYRFFKAAAHRKMKHWIWIDQVCIQQEIVEERNHQVSMMAKIYRNAEEVITWLSDKEKSTDVAARDLTDLFETRNWIGRSSTQRI